MTHTGKFKGLSEKYYEQIKPRLMRRIGREIRPAHRVLDLGCGNCELAKYLATTYAQDVTGVDISDKDFPARVAKSRSTGTLRCVKTDAKRLNFLGKSSVDAAVSLWAFHEMALPAEILLEVERVLRPGGKVLLVDFPRGSLAQRLWNENYFSPREIAEMLATAGFTEVRCKVIERGQIVFCRAFKAGEDCARRRPALTG